MAKETIVNPFTGETVSVNHLDRRGQPMTPWGGEILDPIPMAPPVGYKRQPTMVEHIRNIVRSERLAQEMAAAGFDTFEESEDFEVGDEDADPASQWENDFDPPINEVREAVEAERAKAAPPPKAPARKAPAASEEAAPAPSDDVGE